MNEDADKIFQLALDRLGDESLKSEFSQSGSFAATELPKEGLEQDAEEAEPEVKQNLAQAIRGMSVPQRVKLAMFGNQTARTILLRDANRLIPLFVLENPRLTENEIMEIAKNTQVDESVLRAVGKNLEWMRNYAVKLSIVSNPKTPLDTGLKWLKYIKDKDMAKLAKSKNIPQTISTQAKKAMEKKYEKPSGGG